MNIPLIHTEAAGLYIDDAEVSWVGLTARWGEVQRMVHVREPVEDGDVRAALEQLVEVAAPREPYVASHLDPKHVRLSMLDGPGIEDDESLEAWVFDHAARCVPAGGRLDGFVVRYDVHERTEQRTRCLLAVAPQEAVVQRRQLLTAVGLEPVVLSAVASDLGLALAYRPEFLEGRWDVLLVRAHEAALAEYRDGVFDKVRVVTGGSAAPGTLVREIAIVRSRGTDGPSRSTNGMHVVGCDRIAEVQQLIAQGGVVVAEEDVLLEVDGELVPIAPDAVPAVALSLRQLYPSLGSVNFLGTEDAVAGLRQQERRAALQVFLYGGGAVFALLLLTVVAGSLLQALQSNAEGELLRLADRVTEVQAERAVVQRLEREVAHAERLVMERTYVAVVLEEIGRAVPDGLWLERLALKTSASGGAEISVKGLTLTEEYLSTFLGRLEREEALDGIRLVYSESVPAWKLYRRASARDRLLAQFQVDLDWTPADAGEEATPP